MVAEIKRLTLVMKRNDKGAWEWGCKVEVDVGPSVIRDIALLNDSLLLQLLVCEFIWAKNLLLLLLSLCALTL